MQGLAGEGMKLSPQMLAAATKCHETRRKLLNPLKPMFPKGFLNGRKSAEWKPLQPKWHSIHDPEYFHCHQDSPYLCERCKDEWGRNIAEDKNWMEKTGSPK
jgi:hypothetical protein